MSCDSRVEVSVPPPTDAGGLSKQQFLLSNLFLAMLLIAIFCAAIRWLGTVWIIPISLASVSGFNLVLAVYPRIKLADADIWQLAAWLGMASIATGFAVNDCLDYNTVAGTDKTPTHIIQISATVLAGPMVGPVANPAAGEYPQARTWTGILFALLFVATTPFLLERRVVRIPVALICWICSLGRPSCGFSVQ